MKRLVKLDKGWLLKQASNDGKIENNRWINVRLFPAQVHDVLVDNGILDTLWLPGKVQECLWVAESDWIYRKEFEFKEFGNKVYIHFKGLDTLVDIYLNGTHIGYHNDMYIPLKIDITQYVKDKNTLDLHFHSPHKYINQYKMPAKWEGVMKPYQMVRKPTNDFNNYIGPNPYLTRIGVYDDVIIEIVDEIEIIEADISPRLIDGYKKAEVFINIKGQGKKGDAKISVNIISPYGNIVSEVEKEITPYESQCWDLKCKVTVENPELWWPM
jgi:beta-mannosidase